MTPAARARAENQAISTDAMLEPLHVESRRREALEMTRSLSEIADDAPNLTLAASPEGAAVMAQSVSPADEIEEQAKARATLRSVTKRTLDIVGAVGLAIVFSPLILGVSVFLHRRGGSIIYRHRRIGVGGAVFECLKFRTMVPDADRVLHELLEQDDRLKAEWIQDHKLRHDPRVTRIGRFLRRTSLDELPQLWNVIRGDMSLVGPRPVVREELLRYGRAAQLYLSVKPGVTGLWQAMGRNDTDYRRRVAMDVYYVRNQTFLFDCYILVRTAGVVLAGNGAY